jgi:polyisoprenoid-binding protein YceI
MKNKISLALFSFLIMGLLNSVTAQTKKYDWDAVHANINFEVDYLKFSETTGRFTKSSGSLEYSKPNFSDAKIIVEADVNSVNTDNEQRDGHLKSPDFFDATKFPSIKFVSTSFKKVKGVNYKINGQLTI